MAPDDAFALRVRGDIYRAMGRNDEAIADYRQLFSPEYDIDLLTLRQKALALLDFFQQFQIKIRNSSVFKNPLPNVNPPPSKM